METSPRRCARWCGGARPTTRQSVGRGVGRGLRERDREITERLDLEFEFFFAGPIGERLVDGIAGEEGGESEGENDERCK